jgi:hypothetical protein
MNPKLCSDWEGANSGGNERLKILTCNNSRGLAEGRETALGSPNAPPRPLPADCRHTSIDAGQIRVAEPNLRVLARPEQDPRTLHWRRCWQWHRGRQAQRRRASGTQIKSPGPARRRSMRSSFRLASIAEAQILGRRLAGAGPARARKISFTEIDSAGASAGKYPGHRQDESLPSPIASPTNRFGGLVASLSAVLPSLCFLSENIMGAHCTAASQDLNPSESYFLPRLNFWEKGPHLGIWRAQRALSGC